MDIHPVDEREATDALDAPAPSLRDLAYEAIKHRIITCAYRPGEYLNEAFVSTQLGIGRTPVHQALGRLMLEGLVEVMPRKGVIVKPVSLDAVMQIVDVRLLNEPAAARLAAERASVAELADMRAILGRAEAATEARDIEQLMLVDRDFHAALASATRNAELADMLRRLQDRSLRFWFISLNAPGHLAEVQAEHAAMLAALASRDPGAAEAATRVHIESFRRNVVHNI